MPLGDDHFGSEYIIRGTRNGSQFAYHGTDVFTIKDDRVQRRTPTGSPTKDTGVDIIAAAAALAVA